MQLLAPVPQNYNLLVKDNNVLSSLHSKPVLTVLKSASGICKFPMTRIKLEQHSENGNNVHTFPVAPIFTKTTYEKKYSGKRWWLSQ